MSVGNGSLPVSRYHLSTEGHDNYAASFSVGRNPTRPAITSSISVLKSRHAPFISADTRGCVVPGFLAASFYVQSFLSMCSRSAAIGLAHLQHTRFGLTLMERRPPLR